MPTPDGWIVTANEAQRRKRPERPADPIASDILRMCDYAYAERNRLVAALIRISGWRAWYGGDPEWPEYRVVYVETPKGQLSWHVKADEMEQFGDLHTHGSWDGHGTHEKYARLAALSREDIR